MSLRKIVQNSTGNLTKNLPPPPSPTFNNTLINILTRGIIYMIKAGKDRSGRIILAATVVLMIAIMMDRIVNFTALSCSTNQQAYTNQPQYEKECAG